MLLILPIILILGGLLRWYQLAMPSYWMDEGFSIATAQQLLLGDWLVRSPLYHLALGLVGSTSNWNIYLLRGLSVLVGLSMVAAGYWAAKRWFNQTAAAIFGLLLATATLEIAWSRQVRMYILLQLCFWLALYTYHQWRQYRRHWIWTLLCTLGAIFSHEFGYFVLVAFLWYELPSRFKRTQVLVMLASLIVIYLSYYFVFPASPHINYWWHYWFWLITNYGLLLPLAGLGIATHAQYSRLLNWLVAIWLGWLWCLSFMVPLLQYRYLMMTFPIILLLTALGLTWLWQQRWLGKCAVLVCVGVLLWQHQLTRLPQAFYPLESDTTATPFNYKSFTPQPNFAAAYQFIQQYQSEHPDTLVATPYPELHRLYAPTEPDYTVFINLTGGSYSEVPVGYADPTRMNDSDEVLLVMDQFAEYRMDLRWLQLPKELLWEERGGPWSIVSVYRIL